MIRAYEHPFNKAKKKTSVRGGLVGWLICHEIWYNLQRLSIVEVHQPIEVHQPENLKEGMICSNNCP